MPPRYAYWTILAGGLPTAFRAAERADLLPTFNRIREKHPDAEMKWFARGRLWASPEDAQADLLRARVRRSRDWRPGGEHRDPRQKFKNDKLKNRGERETSRPPSKPRGPAARPAPPRGPAARPGPPREAAARSGPPRGPAARPGPPRGPAARPSPPRERTGPPRKRQR